MQGTVVGVLRGGSSREHDSSLATGATLLEHLSPERFLARDIYIDRAGQWHLRGRAIDPLRALQGVDVALIGLHGEYGEDGEVQKMLLRAGVPYTGSDSFESFLASHRIFSKERVRGAGIKTPEYRLFEQGGDVDTFVHDVIRSFAQPVVVKPVRYGSPFGVQVVGGYAQVLGALEALAPHDTGGVLIEEFIRGRPTSVGVVEKFRGEALYTLPAVETRTMYPGGFTRVEAEDLAIAAKTIHKTLGLRHYSSTDFIVSPRGIFYLKTSVLPSLTHESPLAKSLAAIGVSLRDFVTHLVDLALAR